MAALLFVDPKTVTRWAAAGRLTTTRTLGGHRRYVRDEVVALAASLRHRPRDQGADEAGARVEQTSSSAATVARAVDEAEREASAQALAAVRLVVAAAARAEQVLAEDAARHRDSRLVAARAAAHLVARGATLDAARTRHLADTAATQVQEAADVAAAGLARVGRAEDSPESVRRALARAAVVRATARATSRETRRAAESVARDVAAAAAGVAATVAVLERVIEVEVLENATARQAVTRSAAEAVARSFAARSVALATSAREAAAAARTRA